MSKDTTELDATEFARAFKREMYPERSEVELHIHKMRKSAEEFQHFIGFDPGYDSGTVFPPDVLKRAAEDFGTTRFIGETDAEFRDRATLR